MTTALIRFLIAVPVAGLMIYAFNLVVRNNASRTAGQPAPRIEETSDTGLEAGGTVR